MAESGKGVDVEGIGKSFGSVDALRNISFDVGRGEVVDDLEHSKVHGRRASQARFIDGAAADDQHRPTWTGYAGRPVARLLVTIEPGLSVSRPR